MTVIEVLNNAGTNPYLIRARRRGARLSGEQQSVIATGFGRHQRACRSMDIEPDPNWIAEAVEDAHKEAGTIGRRY